MVLTSFPLLFAAFKLQPTFQKNRLEKLVFPSFVLFFSFYKRVLHLGSTSVCLLTVCIWLVAVSKHFPVHRNQSWLRSENLADSRLPAISYMRCCSASFISLINSISSWVSGISRVLISLKHLKTSFSPQPFFVKTEAAVIPVLPMPILQ